MLPLKVRQLLLLLGGLLLQVGYLKVDVPDQKLSSLPKKDVCSRRRYQNGWNMSAGAATLATTTELSAL